MIWKICCDKGRDVLAYFQGALIIIGDGRASQLNSVEEMRVLNSVSKLIHCMLVRSIEGEYDF